MTALACFEQSIHIIGLRKNKIEMIKYKAQTLCKYSWEEMYLIPIRQFYSINGATSSKVVSLNKELVNAQTQGAHFPNMDQL